MPRLPKPAGDPSPCDHESATVRLPAALTRSQERMGEEAATPGQPVRARAQFLDSPAIHPRESPVAAGSAAIIRQDQELSRFAEFTLSENVAPRNTKNLFRCAETVDDVSSLWKSEEN
jgi:hypothetical protein